MTTDYRSTAIRILERLEKGEVCDSHRRTNINIFHSTNVQIDGLQTCHTSQSVEWQRHVINLMDAMLWTTTRASADRPGAWLTRQPADKELADKTLKHLR